MKKPCLPPNEEERLFQLRSYDILDTDDEITFDHITNLAAEVCGTEIALITLVDEKRQWFKSRHGLTIKETPREISFCAHTILGTEPLIVNDARKDDRFFDNPVVIGEPHVIFYAGIPLATAAGVNLGTLCVVDSSPKVLSESQKQILTSLSKHVIDLLDLRKKNRELKALTQQYLDVQKMAKTGGWELSAETGEISWSAEIYSIYGLSLSSKPALKDCVKFYAPHEQERISGLYWNSLHNGTSFDEVFEFRDNYLNEKCIRIIGEPVKDASGKILKLKGTFQDITEQKKTEAELRKQVESNRFVLDSVGVGVWKVDLLTGKQEWDSTMYHLFGVSPRTFNPDSWITLLSDEAKKTIEQHTEEIRKGTDSFNHTMKIITPSGEQRYLGASSKVLRNLSGTPTTMFGVNWDRTTEVALQKELDIERAKILHHSKLASIGQLAAGVGHEINNPLAIISTLVTILERHPEESRRPDFLVKMEDAIDRIANIVKGLRTFARSDVNELVSFEPSILINETVNFLKELYKKESVEIHLEDDSRGISMTGNRGRIQQVMVNLINNAKDATLGKETRKINISVTTIGSQLKIKVLDNGHGIPKEIQHKIFDPFFTTKDVNAGTGIGLSIVNTIVKEHHGKLDFVSTPEGTEFSVVFPVDNAIRSSSAPRSSSWDTGVINCRLLLVDDERELLDAMKMILESSFTEIHVAQSADEAIKQVNEKKIDLILTDVKMPVKDGFDLLKMLKSSPKGKDTKIMFLSGGIDMTPDELRIVRSETNGLIPKPIKFPDLIARVKDVLPH